MLDRLERADRPPEGIALQRVIARRLQASFGTADLFEDKQNGGTVQDPLHRTPATTTQSFSRHGIEIQVRLVAGRIDRRQVSPPDAAQISQIKAGLPRFV